MKTNRTTSVIVTVLLAAGLATAFWILALNPKRDEAKKLGAQVAELNESLAKHRAEASAGAEARKQFPVDYQQLVVLGKAVPGNDETASLLVQLNRIADRTNVRFQDFKLNESTAGAEPTPAPEASGSTTAASTPVSPTEAAASTMPLGASIGPAGLAVMPYNLKFKGGFFRLADFIQGLDSLVKTKSSKVSVNGRLLTINGFALKADTNAGFPSLEGTFSVTTFLTPPNQGVVGGATPSAPASPTATPASTTTGGTP